MELTYRTKDGADYFKFDIVDKGWFSYKYRIYIVAYPTYGSRLQDGHNTHRYQEPAPPAPPKRHYVCWSEDIRTFDDAKAIAREWAERTQRYIKYGTPINPEDQK
jgi:hypothetical protein